MFSFKSAAWKLIVRQLIRQEVGDYVHLSRWILKHLMSKIVLYCNEIHIALRLSTFSVESTIVKNAVSRKEK